MSKNGKLELSRRKALASLGAIGVASAGAGLGTSAYFSDEESFDGNTLTAGELDLKVDWEEHYNYPQIYGLGDPTDGLDVQRSRPSSPDEYTGLPIPDTEDFDDDPLVWVLEDDLDQYMANTAIEAFPDPDGDGQQEIQYEDFTYEACVDGADLDEHLEPDGDSGYGRTDNDDTRDGDGEARPLVYLDDVKPGDFGELTLSFHLCDNPGYVWLHGDLVSEDGGEHTEPEEDVDPENEANLAENIQTVWWFDDGDNVLERGDCEEKLFLSDHLGNNAEDREADLYEVIFDDGDAVTTLKATVEEFEASHIGATNDGETVYIVHEFAPELVAYDVPDDSVGNIQTISVDGHGPLGEITQAAVDTNDVLWLASKTENALFEVSDPATNPTVTQRIDLDLNINGADNVFTSNGQFYLYTNSTEALYTVNLVTGTTNKVADVGESLTGVAVRNAGIGEFVGSLSQSSEIITFDEDGTITGEFDLTGDLENHTFGDLTTAELCERVIRRGTLADDLELLSDGAGLALDNGRCFEPGFTRYIGFAWWVPTDVGNEIQGDTVSFNLGFRTEQCRHNDNPGQSFNESES